MESSVLSEKPELRPTASDLDLAYFFAEEARDCPKILKDLKECVCAICKEALRQLKEGDL